ncbi:MAG TPA: hypothetical protein VH143_14035 [Kofleriaceae bacterium]|jgi:uncharacterized membrane protein|nr:hypothetical protein [Kofleriaceae bacterium]
MRIATVVFAAVLIALGIATLVDHAYLPLWLLPDDAPAHDPLVYLCTAVSLAVGAGLLWPRTAPLAARAWFGFVVAWWLIFPVRLLVHDPGELGAWYGVAEPAVLVAAAWILATSRGVPIARVIYGLALVPFGLGHFAYLERTESLVPSWLPAHHTLALVTGGAFLAATLAIITGVWARLAAALSALQLGLFTVLVWVSLRFVRPLDAFEWNEVGASIALAVAGWIVTESYRDVPWLGFAWRRAR